MASLTASSLSKQMALPVKWRTSSATAAGLATAVSGARLPCMMASPARVENGFSREVMTSVLRVETATGCGVFRRWFCRSRSYSRCTEAASSGAEPPECRLLCRSPRRRIHGSRIDAADEWDVVSVFFKPSHDSLRIQTDLVGQWQGWMTRSW